MNELEEYADQVPLRPKGQPRTLRYHSTAGARPMAAGRIILVGIIAFTLAGLFNADSLHAQASRQPYGWKRNVLLDLVGPMRWVSHTTRLNRPHADIQRAIGRPPIEGSPSTVVVTTRPASAPPPAIVLPRPSRARPLTLWVGGDSMVQEFGTSVLEKASDLGTFKATLDYHISTGLTRPDYFDWPAHLQSDVLPTKPQVMVIMFGANDSQSLEIPDGGPVYKPDSPTWQAEYRKRVARTMDQVAGNGRLVVWVGVPNMRDPGFNTRMQALDVIYRSEAAKRPWIRFLDSRPLLAPKGGGYAAYLPNAEGEPTLARQSDGIHLSRYGADIVADAVYRLIDKEIVLANRHRPSTTTSTTKP